ncbi:hypothetical protein RIB2604_00602080 [Aspergillus luchuensis]|uniref:Uncharacterized protein n=1 Tax=Aspergillus kawachii TaxID=1069201 RepID=A0A146F069_ASPKA|nr:hypothetical protein RIB2604_00602080 [Aspergillus luchuensis]
MALHEPQTIFIALWARLLQRIDNSYMSQPFSFEESGSSCACRPGKVLADILRYFERIEAQRAGAGQPRAGAVSGPALQMASCTGPADRYNI